MQSLNNIKEEQSVHEQVIIKIRIYLQQNIDIKFLLFKQIQAICHNGSYRIVFVLFLLFKTYYYPVVPSNFAECLHRPFLVLLRHFGCSDLVVNKIGYFILALVDSVDKEGTEGDASVVA